MQSEIILKMEGICKSFPGVRALDNVDFVLRKGEIHALMGENGAGKSTLIKIITGVYQKDAGQIYLEGKPVNLRSPQDAQNMGIGTVFQEIALCPNLTVAENMYIGGPDVFVNWSVNETAELLDSPWYPASRSRNCPAVNRCPADDRDRPHLAMTADSHLDETTSHLTKMRFRNFSLMRT